MYDTMMLPSVWEVLAMVARTPPPTLMKTVVSWCSRPSFASVDYLQSMRLCLRWGASGRMSGLTESRLIRVRVARHVLRS